MRFTQWAFAIPLTAHRGPSQSHLRQALAEPHGTHVMRRLAARAQCACSGARRVGGSRIDERRRHAGLVWLTARCSVCRTKALACAHWSEAGWRPCAGACYVCVCVCLCDRCRSLTRSACSSSCSGTAKRSRRFLRKLPFIAFTPQRCSRLDVLFVARAPVADFRCGRSSAVHRRKVGAVIPLRPSGNPA